ncbi:HAD-IB family hydrolase [Alcaligenes faecalis]|uniref:HAD-IB family hydrolase n=1 Tax=Alcaligenes ammonioxydans TaxID=2582914 RepID=A0ABX8SUV4_9BURK|nr:HAD-IB family hydrolase [Alcaligenes ammonioxydans]
MKGARVLVAFDFDGTITDRDSLQDFIRRMRGWPVCIRAYLACVPRFLVWDRGPLRRQAIKHCFLRSALGGLSRAQVQALADVYVRDYLPRILRPEMMERVRAHRERGDTVLLVSASPSIYLQLWAHEQGMAQVLATDLAFDEHKGCRGLASANCWGEEKVRRLQAWLGDKPVELDMAYGDSPGDGPMLAHTRQPWLRGRDAALPRMEG